MKIMKKPPKKAVFCVINMSKNNPKKDIAKIANAKFANSKIAKMAVNVNDNVNVNVNDNVTTTVVNYNASDSCVDGSQNENVNDSCVDGLQECIEFYNQNVGLLTQYGLEVLEDYAQEMDYEVIIYAMKLAVEANKRQLNYIKAILNNWSKAGIKTLLQAQEENKARKDSRDNGISEETQEEKDARKIKELKEAMKDDN